MLCMLAVRVNKVQERGDLFIGNKFNDGSNAEHQSKCGVAWENVKLHLEQNGQTETNGKENETDKQ